MDFAGREMTLAEYVGQLHPGHRAVKEYQDFYDAWDRLAEIEQELASKDAEIERLLALLSKYGTHLSDCSHDKGPYDQFSIGPCTCGWEEEKP